jgi:hypothetical protein
MNTLEERLWNYIDGTCSDEEKKAIKVLIAGDMACKSKYENLLALNQEFSKMELDEPSMAFTYNVMETIRAGHAMQPLKAGINKRIVTGISGFFIVSISLLLIYVLSSVHLSAGNLSAHVPVSIKLPDLKNYFSVPVFRGFLFFDVVLALFLLDSYLRKRGVSKQV